MKKIKLDLKFKFGDTVTTIVSDKVMVISKVTINSNLEVIYCCLTPENDYHWFYDYELKNIKEGGYIGFSVEL